MTNAEVETQFLEHCAAGVERLEWTDGNVLYSGYQVLAEWLEDGALFLCPPASEWSRTARRRWQRFVHRVDSDPLLRELSVVRPTSPRGERSIV